MPDKQRLIEDLDWITARISGRVWTISVGVMAFSLSFIIEASNNPTSPFLGPREVIGPSVCALVAVLSDLLQYVAGYRLSVNLLRTIEKHGIDEWTFDPGDPWFKLRVVSYWLKIAFCFLGTIWLIVVVSNQTIHIM